MFWQHCKPKQTNQLTVDSESGDVCGRAHLVLGTADVVAFIHHFHAIDFQTFTGSDL